MQTLGAGYATEHTIKLTGRRLVNLIFGFAFFDEEIFNFLDDDHPQAVNQHYQIFEVFFVFPVFVFLVFDDPVKHIEQSIESFSNTFDIPHPHRVIGQVEKSFPIARFGIVCYCFCMQKEFQGVANRAFARAKELH